MAVPDYESLMLPCSCGLPRRNPGQRSRPGRRHRSWPNSSISLKKKKKKARKGVFLTTSTFTNDALRSVADYSARIVLIDGPALAELMIEHDVGVSVTTAYQLKRLDSDFFDEGYSDA